MHCFPRVFNVSPPLVTRPEQQRISLKDNFDVVIISHNNVC